MTEASALCHGLEIRDAGDRVVGDVEEVVLETLLWRSDLEVHLLSWPTP